MIVTKRMNTNYHNMMYNLKVMMIMEEGRYVHFLFYFLTSIIFIRSFILFINSKVIRTLIFSLLFLCCFLFGFYIVLKQQATNIHTIFFNRTDVAQECDEDLPLSPQEVKCSARESYSSVALHHICRSHYSVENNMNESNQLLIRKGNRTFKDMIALLPGG